ncbi:MAG: glycoside hydrolase family 97 protein [Bacteroidales bacterium]|nr:glycoside hydrolase family 97 protein [Bacteroidales bacterium]
MKNIHKTVLACCLAAICQQISAQSITVLSPDKAIAVTIENGKSLGYSVKFRDRIIIGSSPLGFELKDEPVFDKDFAIIDQKTESIRKTWKPVVKSKHAEVLDNCNELRLKLKEKSGLRREMDLYIRSYNDGVAFRYKLYRGEKIGNREITKELTGFNIPGDPKAWIAEYGGYSTSNESEFFEHNISYLTGQSIAGLPLLMDYGNNCWVALTEAKIDNYSAFYVGTNGTKNQLTTKLVPIPGQKEEGSKVRFDDEVFTPWRVIMIGETPGILIESEIIQNLNDPCAIADPSWIKPGTSAWDHWWSGEVKMEMPVVKQYIDLAAEMGWEYMLIDWKWYGEFNKPEADITKVAPQINMPELIAYAKSKNVNLLVWLYSKDVNRNSAYKKAFPLYKKWGLAGIKIDFMERDDQEMVNWYLDIIKCAADNKLLVDFHGAYKPDGIIRTYPNMITREGVMGNEFYKFSEQMNPEHNVKLAFTRMLAGQMDYTPGGFLNVTKEQFKKQSPTLVWNTRAAELSKFVIYESPLTVVCDHPDNILNKPGADFLKIVPTVWDNTKFIGGYPGEYIAMARQNGNTWFVGVMNNSKRKTVEIKLDFLTDGIYEMEIWADSKKSDTVATELQKKKQTVKKGDVIKVELANNGGFVSTICKKSEN